MDKVMIGTVEVVLLVVGLVELIKGLGLQGKQVWVLAFGIGGLLGCLSYAFTEGLVPELAGAWMRVVVGGLWVGVKGLAAAGLVKFGVARVERVVGFAVRYNVLMRAAGYADEPTLPFEPTPVELENWAKEEDLPLA